MVTVRAAEPRDLAAMDGLVRALAEYERAPHEVQLEEGQLHDALFGAAPQVFAHVAEHRGQVVGAALWFVSYSTWTGHHGIYLEDLFVLPSARGLGAGRALLTELARLAVARRYTRVEWAVLDWNEAAIGFYRHLGAQALDGWTVYRLAGENLRRLGGKRPNDVSPTRAKESYSQE
jgi:GNAT superfamily N-acetyltransferase